MLAKKAFGSTCAEQIFDGKEKIEGYSNLTISIYFTASTLIPLIDISYDKKKEGAFDLDKSLNQLFRGSSE